MKERNSYGFICSNAQRDVVKNEGFKALTRGISAAYYGSIVYGMVYFSLYKTVKAKWRDFFEKRN